MQTCDGRPKHEQTNKDYTKDEDGRICCCKCLKIFTQLPNFYRHNKDIHINPKVRDQKKTQVYCLLQGIWKEVEAFATHENTY